MVINEPYFPTTDWTGMTQPYGWWEQTNPHIQTEPIVTTVTISNCKQWPRANTTNYTGSSEQPLTKEPPEACEVQETKKGDFTRVPDSQGHQPYHRHTKHTCLTGPASAESTHGTVGHRGPTPEIRATSGMANLQETQTSPPPSLPSERYGNISGGVEDGVVKTLPTRTWTLRSTRHYHRHPQLSRHT